MRPWSINQSSYLGVGQWTAQQPTLCRAPLFPEKPGPPWVHLRAPFGHQSENRALIKNSDLVNDSFLFEIDSDGGYEFALKGSVRVLEEERGLADPGVAQA